MKTNDRNPDETLDFTDETAPFSDTSKHLYPLDRINGFDVRPGFFMMTGAVAFTGGVSFTVQSVGATSCELLLFHRKAAHPYAVIPFPETYKIGHVYSMAVFGLDFSKFEYAYRLDGPYDPSRGLLFDKSHILLDPYAKAVTGQSVWGSKEIDSPGYRGRVVRNIFDWESSVPPKLPMDDLIIYEAHVRGFTKMAPDVEYPGTYAALKEKIPYLKELGVNAVELMPIFEFDEMADHRIVDGRQLLNYWGYNTISFFAPNTSYTAAVEYNHEGRELKELIKALHDNGIEIILDVVFNHTAEGNEDGPFISFKGFDNNIYYLLTPDGKYYNFSGCGNVVNCNHPIVRNLILDCLRYWTATYHVDGFRFDLASILGRNEDGSAMSKPPLVHALAEDPILGDVKLIAEAWDAGGLYQVGNFPSFKRWAEWNGRYRDDIRRYLKGDLWQGASAAQRITGSHDIYDPQYRGSNASINFLTCHDGFTLYDLYAYNEKHNEANGWNNTDGSNDNSSWNCGAEGETDDPEILALRFRLIKNAFATLMCSHGTPMFLSGDEFGNSQFGNNNAYCQDNEISWLDWSLLEKNQDLFTFCKYMTAFRHRHAVIRRPLPPSSTGLPPISQHAETPWVSEFLGDVRFIGTMFAGYDECLDGDDIIYFGINAYWESLQITLPTLPKDLSWYVAVNTGNAAATTYPEDNMPSLDDNCILIGARSVIVLIAR